MTDMSRDRETRTKVRVPALPLVPLVLAAAGMTAGWLAGQSTYPGALAGVALLLTAGACTAAGALWHRGKVAARLAEARSQQHLLMQLNDAWLWQTDAEHRLVRLQPPQAAPGSSWAGGACAGQPLWERFPDGDGALAARMQAQSHLPDIEVRPTHLPPPSAPWRLRGLPRLDGQGRFAGYLGVVRPAAVGPAAPAEAASAQAVADDHAALTYTVSHDLRAPLRVIDGFGRILKEDYGQALDRIGNDHLDRMIAAAARMNLMLDALLALSRLSAQPLARQTVNLSQLAQFVVDDLRRAAPERQVQVSIEPGMEATGDPTLLRMALENLLGNAWKYTAQRAEAHISFERTPQDGRSVFTVRDDGAGFDMRFADRLFGVFQRLHSGSEFQGHGVGLASVRRIVRRHGGEIWADADVGKGARFYFTLGA